MDEPEFLARMDTSSAIAQGAGTVAVLDAACWFGLPERLEVNDIDAVCLFKGNAAKDLRDVAPYLVRITPEGQMLQDLLDPDDALGGGWTRRPGILLRTDMSLQALQKHFRRFLRVSFKDKPFFFRFWEPDPLRAYFQALPAGDAMRQRWFHGVEGGVLDAIWIPDLDKDGFTIVSRAPSDTSDIGTLHKSFHLRQPEIDAILRVRMGRDVRELAALLAQTFPDQAKVREPKDFERGVAWSVARARKFGLNQKDHLVRIAAWDMHSGGAFERTDPKGELARILQTREPEPDKMKRLAARLRVLET